MEPAVLIAVLALGFAVGYLASVRWIWFALATLAGFGVMAGSGRLSPGPVFGSVP
jgi:hypothetical protein